ncbi:MAG: hypothetical protein M5R40_25190 [Anaerolineae bacterium]|nr:hypothetical protein [Anaerolineae bacterium]
MRVPQTVEERQARAWAGRARFGVSSQTLLGYALVAPLILWLAFTILYPLISAVRLSFLDVGIIGTGGDFVGLRNYERILTGNQFWPALGRSLFWVVANAVVQTLAAFATALILRQRFPGRGRRACGSSSRGSCRRWWSSSSGGGSWAPPAAS